MGTTVERDLKTLRTSKLMNFSEFKTMIVVLEKYYKEQGNDRKENRELDMRPFLYDDGDTYEKPFYNILLKMLYEVASFQSHDKQYEDLLKVYEWFKSNQTLITGDSGDNEKNSEMNESSCNSDIQMPKLYLRPKTADGGYYRETAKDTPGLVCDREPRSRSVLGTNEYKRMRKAKSYNPLDRISVALRVLPLNVKAAKGDYTMADTLDNEAPYVQPTKRSLNASIPIYNTRNNRTASLPSTFVLKSAKQTVPLTSTPVSTLSMSPVTSPRLISPSLSPRSSPVHRPHSPIQLSLSGHGATGNAFAHRKFQRSNASGEPNNFELATSAREPRSPKEQPRLVFNEDVVEINDISNPSSLADEEREIFQNQLKQRLKYETDARGIEIFENLKKDSALLEQERGDLESQLLQEHKMYLRDRLKAEDNGKHQRTEQQNEMLFDDEKDPDVTFLPLVNVYDISDHRPVSAVTFRNSAVRVESVLDMVQPVGHQMQHEREMRNPQHGLSIWNNEYTSDDKLIVHELHRLHSAPASHTHGIYGLNQTKVTENSTRLKQTEPILNPENKANDYTVHFPHQCNREPSVKDFKTSGPVTPDTIRYQWTDDGFGNRTYIKKRVPKEMQVGKSPRKSLPSTKNEVAMTTGELGLDKRTIASLMVIRHIGVTHPRDRDYPKIAVDGCNESTPASNEDDDLKPKRNVEYLPFWKQMPSKKGLTILNFPEKLEHPVDRCDDAKKKDNMFINGTQNYFTETTNSSSPQQIVNEMFSSLSPGRRTMGKKVDATLSVNAQSISPTARQPVKKLVQTNKRSGISPAPSRPSSARRTPSPSSRENENISRANFSVKDFSHFCLDDDYELLDDYMRQREIWAAVNIQRIFRGHMARLYATSLRQAERERQRKAAIALQSTFRGYLARKKLMKENIIKYKPGVRDLHWAKEYKEQLKEKEILRNKRNQEILRKQNRQLEKRQEQMMGVTASDMIHEIFNPPKASKAAMKAAAITIQRYFRGWFVRKSLKRVKEKALKRTFDFNKFIKSYQDLVYRIQKRYNIENPTTALQFHELQEYVDRLFRYEIAFGKIAENGTVKYEDILRYFAECGHHPSEKEVDDAIALVTKDSPRGRNLTKSEAVEVVFQIYIPKGTGLSLNDVRKSTWMNPLINGEDVTKLLSKKDLKFTSLDKCLSLVGNSQADTREVRELLRPPDPGIMNVVEKMKEKENPRTVTPRKKTSRPSSAKVPGGGKFILTKAQYHQER